MCLYMIVESRFLLSELALFSLIFGGCWRGDTAILEHEGNVVRSSFEACLFTLGLQRLIIPAVSLCDDSSIFLFKVHFIFWENQGR